ncbi:hypothetical protein DSO57_1020544 [Entomophthora muscae]|uniref:Uncharacterized protein n=1 Tax=Entomophthora muscae TaxID=34485 RepID=A0ACC2RUV9_9FUNG|nr:hypothetical protein DSO57_1020544 [Entomophthora muscae]
MDLPEIEIENNATTDLFSRDIVERHLKGTDWQPPSDQVSFVENCIASKYGSLSKTNFRHTIPRDNLEIGLFQLNKSSRSLADFELCLPQLDMDPTISTSSAPEKTNDLELLEAVVIYCSRLRSLIDHDPTGIFPIYSPLSSPKSNDLQRI